MENLVIGYVYNKYGYYDKKYYFEGTVEKVALFIYQHRDKKITITDGMDEPIYTTPHFYETVSSDWCERVNNRVIDLVNHRSKECLKFILQDNSWIEQEEL